MAIAGAGSAVDAGLEAVDGFRVAAGLGEGLRGHEVAGSVVGILSEEGIEFPERSVGLAALHQFHGDAIAGKTALWVESENFFESCNLIHIGRSGEAATEGRLEKCVSALSSTQGRRSLGARRLGELSPATEFSNLP